MKIYSVKYQIESQYRMLLHLINVGVPHLGEEPEGRWRVWVVYRELDPSLEEKESCLKFTCGFGVYHKVFLAAFVTIDFM